jgi:hypothetical protein
MEFHATRIDKGPQLVGNEKDMGGSTHCSIFPGPDAESYDSKRRFFRYDVVVRDLFAGHPDWSHFEIKAIPHGQFVDQVAQLHLVVTWGKTMERGIISLPLHSLSNEDYLSAAPESDPIEVHLGGDQMIRINVTNKLKAMKLILHSMQVTYTDPSLWDNKPSSFTLDRVLNEQETVPLDVLSLRANPGRAIASAIFRKNAEDTKVTAVITYAPQSGGKPRDLAVTIGVRFVPTLPYLAGVLAPFALLGSLLRALEQRQPLLVWLRAVLSAVLAALILEVAGIALTSLHCEFKLFGVLLDPLQVPQVALFSVIVGLVGVNIAAIARGLFDKDRGGLG